MIHKLIDGVVGAWSRARRVSPIGLRLLLLLLLLLLPVSLVVRLEGFKKNGSKPSGFFTTRNETCGGALSYSAFAGVGAVRLAALRLEQAKTKGWRDRLVLVRITCPPFCPPLSTRLHEGIWREWYEVHTGTQ